VLASATLQIQVLLLLRELQCELGLAVIFVTHDIGVAVEVTVKAIGPSLCPRVPAYSLEIELIHEGNFARLRLKLHPHAREPACYRCERNLLISEVKINHSVTGAGQASAGMKCNGSS